MGHQPARTTLQLSIELGLAAHQTALAQHRQLNEFVNQFLTQLAVHQIPATWAVPEVAGMSCVESIRATDTRHEIALLADSTWLGANCSRAELMAELPRRLEGPIERELPVTSIVLRDIESPAHLDLLARQGIRVVRLSSTVSHRSVGTSGVQLLRHGIAAVPVALNLPMPGSWLGPFAAALRSRHMLHRMISRGGQYHVAIQPHRFLDDIPQGLKNLDRLWTDLDRFQSEGQVQFQTLAAASAQRAMELRRQPARSALRPAA